MPHFKISQDAAQAILDYLQTKPYREVFQLVPLLIGLEPLPEDAEGWATPTSPTAPTTSTSTSREPSFSRLLRGSGERKPNGNRSQQDEPEKKDSEKQPEKKERKTA